MPCLLWPVGYIVQMSLALPCLHLWFGCVLTLMLACIHACLTWWMLIELAWQSVARLVRNYSFWVCDSWTHFASCCQDVDCTWQAFMDCIVIYSCISAAIYRVSPSLHFCVCFHRPCHSYGGSDKLVASIGSCRSSCFAPWDDAAIWLHMHL